MSESACLVIIILLQPHFTVTYCVCKIEFWPKNEKAEDLKKHTFLTYRCMYLVMMEVKELWRTLGWVRNFVNLLLLFGFQLTQKEMETILDYMKAIPLFSSFPANC